MRDVRGARHVAVVGGGIAGLAAGYFLRTAGDHAPRVTVIEAAPHIGGKLRLGEVAGVSVDLGAETLLARRPEALELLDAVGLGDEIVHPAAMTAQIFSRGGLRPLPAAQVAGVPADLGALAASGLLSRRGLARVALDLVQPRAALRADAAVGGFLGARLGREVVDRLVEPMLGGVYAGRAAELSLAATMPDLAVALRQRRSVIRAAQAVRNKGASAPGPVFAGLPGGVGRLPATVAEASGCEIRTGAPALELRRTPAGWQVVVGSAQAPETLDADAVIVAAPARPASRLFAGLSPAAARELAAIDYANVAIVTLAYNRPGGTVRDGGSPVSGILVPAVEHRTVKGVTFSSAKWQWMAAADPGTMIVRASIGRYGDHADLQRDDEELVATAADELADLAGLTEKPIDALVTRWGGGLPQYTVGHVDRVRRLRAAIATLPGLAVCGAAYDGVGVPACIATARAAADAIVRTLSR